MPYIKHSVLETSLYADLSPTSAAGAASLEQGASFTSAVGVWACPAAAFAVCRYS